MKTTEAYSPHLKIKTVIMSFVRFTQLFTDGVPELRMTLINRKIFPSPYTSLLVVCFILKKGVLC